MNKRYIAPLIIAAIGLLLGLSFALLNTWRSILGLDTLVPDDAGLWFWIGITCAGLGLTWPAALLIRPHLEAQWNRSTVA